LAHATQVDPTSPFWFGLPPEVMDGIHPKDDYQLALVASATDEGVSFTAIDPATMTGPDSIETDLFAGVRATADGPVAR
jgi:hypothetical protein